MGKPAPCRKAKLVLPINCCSSCRPQTLGWMHTETSTKLVSSILRLSTMLYSKCELRLRVNHCCTFLQERLSDAVRHNMIIIAYSVYYYTNKYTFNFLMPGNLHLNWLLSQPLTHLSLPVPICVSDSLLLSLSVFLRLSVSVLLFLSFPSSASQYKILNDRQIISCSSSFCFLIKRHASILIKEILITKQSPQT